ncbi:KH domain-containing protein [Deinococcus psychrotolerans]|uniref:KH domain-containing protein n=2 Tax=Deinococcus TaxID=1298 RepID=A0A553V3S7_9DEIO|nr:MULTISPECIES: R3H domain-containing nucleic acid-binding protein [Deinococcus]AZI43453.1 KH domain-containing protein [Deinococcus psychrotolerans]TSA87107.1 KH domain-containing protein [Deinococcus detaillensis]
MDNTNLDDYLANLGISEGDEAPNVVEAALGSAAPPMESQDAFSVFEQFMHGVIEHLGQDLTLTVRDTGEALEADIGGERAGKLAGRDGRTLGAIEVLAYAVLAKHAGRSDVRVRVDAGGFKRRQADNLGKLAERLAVQVAKSGEVHALQPMSPAERRVIHVALKDHSLVTTESVGEGAGRHLVIKPRTEMTE